MEQRSAERNGEGAVDGATPRSSVDKALAICEALSAQPGGLSLRELARQLRLPAATTHRLLARLKQRGYVRRDEDTGRYVLTLKMLDLSFRLLGRSELRLHAYPALREYTLRTGARTFFAVSAAGEVTYVWATGPDEVSMHTVYGREMPGHCAIYFGAVPKTTRRLTCLRLAKPSQVQRPEEAAVRLGAPFRASDGVERLGCTCAPVFDYTGREVARVGVFGHARTDSPILDEHSRGIWELARMLSLRLGYLPAASLGVTA
jgi:IclR family KDG regulon transcriptional repressor